jgi:hypothetical protein
VHQHGFATSELIARWDDLIGPRFARVTRPLRVVWPRVSAEVAAESGRPPATLVVRCEGAHALELQYHAPILIERVNALYGWRAIGKVSIRQGPVDKPRRAAPVPEPPPAPRHMAAQVEAVADEGLREALDRLGRAVAARRTGLTKP